jgi:hypothetical protein
MAEIGSVPQPGAAKPPEDAFTRIGAPAAEPAPDAPDARDAPGGPDAATAASEPAQEPGPPAASVEDPAVTAADATIVREPAVRLAVVSEPPSPAVPADGGTATSFLERAVLRRRIRFLRRRRELALHDLGGFVYETHRLGENRPELTAQKLEGVDAIDGELATLERALALGEELIVLHEPGISSCIHCSTIHDSTARFCPGCGRPTSGAGA